ncbi:MAG: hypothetical protein GY816_04425, partial [Cytophagales bacterium]|nr:hypothetical protein [Cytophagales bacterium]
MRIVVLSYLLLLSKIAVGQFQNGVVIDTVKCSDNTSQSYALYLPSNYSKDRSWPIIYFFEPAARGRLPIKKYHEIAEELGFIMVCSNNSKNGSWDVSFNAADAIFLDTQSKFSIDKNNLFTSGFSGGSRLALSIAVITKKIRGVIGVGATQPSLINYQVREKQNFLYAGLVGNRDMNYQEHKMFSKDLDELGNQNILIVSSYNHRWASAADFRLALKWMLVISNQEQIVSENWIAQNLYLNDTVSRVDKRHLLERFNSSNHFIESWNKEQKKLLREEKRVLDMELKLRKTLEDSMSIMYAGGKRNSSIMNWMNWEINGYGKLKERSKKLATRLMYIRILDFLRAKSIETTMRMVTMPGQLNEALLYMEVFEMIAGSSIYSNWWFAKIYALQHDSKKSMSYLEKMLELGFKNKDTLIKESAFFEMKETEEFQVLINKL